jgi:hypothetical protein
MGAKELLEICENIVHNNGKESGNRTKDAPDIGPGQKPHDKKTPIFK